jgi:hypothetical protein
MKRANILLILLLNFSITFSATVIHALPQSIYFDDSGANIMVLGNNYYEIGFRKSNGGIAYIIDKSTGQHVSEGSRYECLWGAVFYDASTSYIGGCNYNTAGRVFSYSWSSSSQRLTFNYNPNPSESQAVTATVTIQASEVTTQPVSAG